MQKETLILASNNAGKLREMREILEPFGLEVRSQKESGFTAEVAETGTTFQENAIIKAKAVQEALHCAVLADDSGLMIDALDGAPGVYSHRFAGEQATDEDRCNLVLEKLQGVPTEQRTARFVCAICYLTADGEQHCFAGVCEGIIGTEPKGENGFGYDPVFVVGNKTMAEMTEAEKMALGVTANTTDGNEAFNVDYAGKEFYTSGKYFNSVQVKVDVPKGGSRTIRFGILIGQKNDAETPAVFDDFRLLFVSKTVNQDLVLDQDREDLKYLSETTNTYKNVSLHLNKKLIQNKWNSFVLPVDLTASQIRKAFGANTRLAKLSNLTESAIEFASVDMDAVADGKPAMEAYMPYIIFHSGSEKDVTSPNYTAELEKSDGSTVKVMIGADHYVIPSVTVPTKKVGDKEVSDWSNMSNDNWTTSMTSTDGKMMALGTFARTFGDATQNPDGTWNITNKDKILDRRDDLKGCYFFDNGKMYHSDKRARGLRGFSCWFKPTNNNNNPSSVKLTLDGVTQSGTTGIEDILADYEQPVSRYANGIYNLNGQLVKQGNSTAGLPSGLYIVNGKKCIVR